MARVEVRPITIDEAGVFRRAVRAGFGTAETVDDVEWAGGDGRTPGPLRGDVRRWLDRRHAAVVPDGADRARAAATVDRGRAHRRDAAGRRTDARACSRGMIDRRPARPVATAASRPTSSSRPSTRSTAASATARRRCARSGSSTSAAAAFVTPGAGTVEFVDNDTFRKEGPAVFEQVRRSRPGMIGRDDFDWDVTADLRRRPEDKPWQRVPAAVPRRRRASPRAGRATRCKDQWADLPAPFDGRSCPSLCAATPAAEARLWRFLAEHRPDRHGHRRRPTGRRTAAVAARQRPGGRSRSRATTSCGSARSTCPPCCRRAAYTATGRVVLDVVDEQGLATGRFALDASPDGAACAPTSAPADLTMSARHARGGVARWSAHGDVARRRLARRAHAGCGRHRRRPLRRHRRALVQHLVLTRVVPAQRA